MGSIIKAAISFSFAARADLICCIANFSFSIKAVRLSSVKGKSILGLSILGQSNLGKNNVFLGSGESVRLKVYPVLP